MFSTLSFLLSSGCVTRAELATPICTASYLPFAGDSGGFSVTRRLMRRRNARKPMPAVAATAACCAASLYCFFVVLSAAANAPPVAIRLQNVIRSSKAYLAKTDRMTAPIVLFALNECHTADRQETAQGRYQPERPRFHGMKRNDDTRPRNQADPSRMQISAPVIHHNLAIEPGDCRRNR